MLRRRIGADNPSNEGANRFASIALELARMAALDAMGAAVNILLVDDHALFRAGLRMLLAALGREVIILEAASAAEALALLGQHADIQLCLLDLSLKSDDGLGLLQAAKQLAPNMIVVIVSGADDNLTIRNCIDAGAMSFIPKSATPEALTQALQRVLEGEVYLPPQIGVEGIANMKPLLTPRQREVLRYLSQGLPTKMIARHLDVSEYTVKEHIALIFLALGVRNRTEAVIRASRLYLLESV
jgi:DNA-binding NarL/FixJ family response regulator